MQGVHVASRWLVLASTTAWLVACRRPPTDRAPPPARTCTGFDGPALLAGASDLAARMRGAVVSVPGGVLGFKPGGAIAVADTTTPGGTIDIVIVEDPGAFAQSVYAGRERIFADRGNEWIPESTIVLRMKLPGAVRPPIPPGAALDLQRDTPEIEGRPPPGLAGPLISAERDYDTGNPHVVVDCLTGVPGRMHAQLRSIVRVARIPGENRIDTRDQTYLPTVVDLLVPVIAREAVDARPPQADDFGFELAGRFAITPDVFATDVWGGPDAAYLGARATGKDAAAGVGLYVVDTRPATAGGSGGELPAVAVNGIGPALDVIARGTTVYVASAGQDHGLYVVDAANSLAPRILGSVDTEHVQPSLHDLFPDGERLYASCMGSCEGHGVGILSAAGPGLPIEIAYHSSSDLSGDQDGSVHDTVVVDGWGGVANWGAGWQIVDFTDAKAPVRKHKFTHEAAQAHSIQPLGRSFAATTDEYAGGHVRFWQLDAAGGPREVASYQSRRSVSAHNLWLDGKILYVAYYQDGVHALDVSDPASPKLVGAFHTYAPRQSSPRSGYLVIFAGAWGVWASGDRVLVSDTEGGLFVLRPGFAR